MALYRVVLILNSNIGHYEVVCRRKGEDTEGFCVLEDKGLASAAHTY